MKAIVPLLLVGLFSLLSGLHAGEATLQPPGQSKLLFSSSKDIANPWGKLHFGVTPVRLIREVQPPAFTFVGGFPSENGLWEVFGQQISEIESNDNPAQRVRTWKVFRARTRDGVTMEDPEVVFESEPAAWTDHFAIARNAITGEYLIIKLKVDDNGFAYTAFFSPNGKDWAAYPNNPLFYDGDAMSLFWSKALNRFVCINKSLQPYRKRFRDHGGPTPSLGDDSLRDRRVLMMRSSPDGRRWEPSVSLSDVWNRQGKKAPIPSEYLTVPDTEDPPDLEFYSGNAFWYHDRAYMMVLNYAASPLMPGKHGPHLDNEWWTSDDGLHWERPARGVNALEVFPQIPRLETAPLVINGLILFPRGHLLLGIPKDRISYVGARANGEFSTKPFIMPSADLLLNAAVPSPDRPFAKDSAYVMVSILDENDGVIPGFEAEKCVIHNEDRCDIPLKWGDTSARQLAGKRVRLRFLMRSAHIYAVTQAANQTVNNPDSIDSQ